MISTDNKFADCWPKEREAIITGSIVRFAAPRSVQELLLDRFHWYLIIPVALNSKHQSSVAHDASSSLLQDISDLFQRTQFED